MQVPVRLPLFRGVPGCLTLLTQWGEVDFVGALMKIFLTIPTSRAATAGKAGKVWSLPRFWVSIRSYKKQPVKKFWGRILALAWLKFAVAALILPFASLTKL